MRPELLAPRRLVLMADRLEAVLGDITRQHVDAIVNAANEALLGGGGVDGAIHRAAGPELLAECRQIGGCPTGQARITSGCRLPARYVIHTVGPIWQGGHKAEAEQLANCYRSSLKLASDHGCRTVAFPAISTGAFGFPISEAARVAVDTVRAFLASDLTIEQVRLVCLDEDNYDAILDVLHGDQPPAAAATA